MAEITWNDTHNSTIQNYATQANYNSSPSNLKTGQNCVPVMIAHLKRYGEDLKIWGIPTRIVTFLAIVDNIDVVSTRVNFEFHDETGSIKGMKWIDSDIVSYKCPVKLHSYARVYGTMRSKHNENYVLIVNIQPMEHLNELCVHLMEVTLVCLEAEKFANQAVQNNLLNSSSTTISNSKDNTVSSTNHHLYGNLDRNQSLIMDIISHGHPEEGAERSYIKAQVPSNLVATVDEILEFLSSEGHIYTTKTDDHFKII